MLNYIKQNIQCMHLLSLYPRKILKYLKDIMKKYVSKDDVEKGLVDPSKPLKDQKDYLDKIGKEEHEKHPNKPKPQPHKKRERENRPKYNWNRRDVTEETPIPDAPKKQIPKPDKDKFFDQLDALKKQIEELNKKKFDLIDQLKMTLRNTNDSKKNTKTVKTKYSGILNEKHNLKKSLQDQMKLLEQKRDEIERQFNQKKQKIASLRKPDSFQDYSKEQLQATLQKTEQKLTTADLTKKQQTQINLRISQIKRALQKSRSDVEVNGQVSKLQDQNDIIFRQLKDIKTTISQKYGELKEVKAEIAKVNQELNNEKTQNQDNRNPQQIKKDYEAKIDAVNQEKNKIKQKIDKLRDAHEKNLDEYEDYADLISYIKMVKQQKEKIKQWKLEQERKKKQREEQEKKRKRQFEEREKRRQQKKQRQQQRRKQVQQRRQKLQKQKEDYINRNPHQDKIDICKALIEYCDSLRPENADKKLEKREQKTVQPILQLDPKESKDWEKQLKKGAQAIIPKKFREQQQEPKKVIKQKKKKQKQVVEGTSAFTHHHDTAKMFQKVNMLPPLTVTEIDESVKQINERIELYLKPSEEEVHAYKEKAQKQFNVMHRIQGDQDRGKKGHYREKDGDDHQEVTKKQDNHEKYEHREKEPKAKSKKNEIVANEKEFPELN